MNANERNHIAKMIDHTILKPEADKEQVAKLCEEAAAYGFASVCVNSSYLVTVCQVIAGNRSEGMYRSWISVRCYVHHWKSDGDETGYCGWCGRN